MTFWEFIHGRNNHEYHCKGHQYARVTQDLGSFLWNWVALSCDTKVAVCMEDLPPPLHLYCQPLHLESYKSKFYAKGPADFKPMRLIPANLINSYVSFIQRVQDWGAKGASSCATSCECCQEGQLAPPSNWSVDTHTGMQFSFFLSLVLTPPILD